MDKAKALEILDDHLEFELEPIGKGMYYNSESNPYGREYILLTNEEYDCLNECLNSEPDSMEKIIEDAKKLGYEVEVLEEDRMILLNPNNHVQLEIKNSYYYARKHNIFLNCGLEINKRDWELVNRWLRLNGVEV